MKVDVDMEVWVQMSALEDGYKGQGNATRLIRLLIVYGRH